MIEIVLFSFLFFRRKYFGSLDMKINIYYVRHGKSVSNILFEKGHIEESEKIRDPELCEEGIQKSIATGKKYVEPDYLFASKHFRAIQTASLMFPKKEINIAPYIFEYEYTHPNHTSICEQNIPRPFKEQCANIDNFLISYKKFYESEEPDFQSFLVWLEQFLYDHRYSLSFHKSISIFVVSHYLFLRKSFSKFYHFNDPDIKNNDVFHATAEYSKETGSLRMNKDLQKHKKE
jgi:broad specificity phosphatase PhoE